jgi:polyphenol oxidase
MSIHYSQNISYLTSDKLDLYGVTHGFFMRHGGCSPYPWKSLNMATSVGDSRENVIENRIRIAESLQINPNNYFDLWQVHSNNVVITDKPRPSNVKHIQADAIITREKQVVLLMLFADCVPIMLFDPDKKVIAISHAGWKGTINGVVAETIKSMTKKFNCVTDNIIGVIGPSICADHYQVGDEVIEQVKTVFNPEDNVISSKDGRSFLDLPAANRKTMEKCGMKIIETLNICTACNTDDWFSHREENGKTGRFAVVITL